uniref:ATP synthase F0 subunit 8 n=1 Tax=Eucheuma denticulatum TaxID=305493 RepID=A0A2H4QI78_9FLOR|nr:ATP synthase F0 subunit 8 [Eucheuma denticulatum]ATX68854.1 ATP synthase F0 subunit 8 [Eucheuma denticulatum]
MPQLDRIIIFTQIFWLFLIFSVLYATLTHFFLPLILKSLKSRKLIIEANSKETINLISKIKAKHNLLKELLIKNLSTVENYLIENLVNSKFRNSSMEMPLVDEKIARACITHVLYCNVQSLESIVLFPKF